MDTKSNEDLPLVSIIVPVYNGSKYLRESLDSTPDIIAGYGDRLRHYTQLHNKRQYQNVNDGLDMVQGKYIAIYHADDVYESAIVQKEVEFFENHPEVGAVFCHDIFINAEG